MAEGYAHPERLVDTEWVANHLDDPDVRVVESDEDSLLYEAGHIPGAVKVDWFTTLQHPVRRDFLSKPSFEAMCREKGISKSTTLIFYGDKSNWFACYALWVFDYFGHRDLRIMDGGRTKWMEEGRPMVKEAPTYPKTDYQAMEPDLSVRAFRQDVFAHLDRGLPLVDVRSPQEYRGELLHMPDYPQEGAMRGGHIPGAANIPWSRATHEDGTFKDADSLRALYESHGLARDEPVIAYCRIGERSSHTWFTLKYLLGFSNVRNYDGSWTEWGNLVGAPIER
jgi:thiosulfate/3-mercaptopyruvate sulfurtransferase